MFKCGPWIGHYAASKYDYDPYGGHTHPDVGTILIFSHGDWLLADEGYAWKRTIYQNTLVVNGKGQIGEGRWFSGRRYVGAPEQPRIVYASTNSEYDYVIGNAGPAYPASTPLTAFYRHILYLKPACWVIADEVKADSTSLFEFYYHSDFPFTPDGTDRFRTGGTRGSMTMTFLRPAGSDKQAFLQDIEHTGGRIARKMSTLKISSAGKTNDLFITLIAAFPTGQNPSTEASLTRSKTGEVLSLDTKKGKLRFLIDSGRKNANNPLLKRVR